MRSQLLRPFLALVLAAAPAAAQTATPAAPAPGEEPSLVDRLKEPDQAGGLHFTEHWAVVFGGIKQGSGIALGPAWSTKFADGGFLQVKGVYSIRDFKLLQLRYDTRRFWNDRGIAITRLRWQDAPELKLYQFGIDSPDRHTDYAERKTEGSTLVILKPTPHVRATAGFGLERYRTGVDDLAALYDPALLASLTSLGLTLAPPGLGTRPLFAHTVGSLGYDTRLSPDYTRGGQWFDGELHLFSDVRGNEDSFGRFEGNAEQFVPTFGGQGVVGLYARTWLSLADAGTTVPFYLMPSLGGGTVLRAFPTYRFRDRHALLLAADYRWAVHAMADVVVTYEAGKVARRVGDLSLDDMAHSIAIGIRAHTDKAGLFRADLAHGREGWGFRIGFSAGS
ncbi:MAG TPA: hypothetical protein VFK57_24245 [Vicinamibacterales bacterium]|nr:hypothetical protein [Vicinamibacterales bacterium]